MNRFFILEGRRILPLFFLLLLLVGLSVYDNFFRVQPVDTLPVAEQEHMFTTTTRGELNTPTSFHLVQTESEWQELRTNPVLELPDYPYSDAHEVAVCTINSEIRGINILSETEEVTNVEVRVNMRPNYYHVIMVNREQIQAPEVNWTFLSETGEVLLQESMQFMEEEPGTGSCQTEDAAEVDDNAAQ